MEHIWTHDRCRAKDLPCVICWLVMGHRRERSALLKDASVTLTSTDCLILTRFKVLGQGSKRQLSARGAEQILHEYVSRPKADKAGIQARWIQSPSSNSKQAESKRTSFSKNVKYRHILFFICHSLLSIRLGWTEEEIYILIAYLPSELIS